MGQLLQFDFGKNWMAFSQRALSPKKIISARLNFEELFKNIEIEKKSFLDIGFGQGLTLLIATEKKANTIGCDINPLCNEVLFKNMCWFNMPDCKIPVVIGSINDVEIIDALIALNKGLFDIVHSWGVLHHTGNMWKAIDHASNLVKPDGILTIAIYNKHFSSKFWHWVKKKYNQHNRLVRGILLAFYLPLLFIRYLFMLKNPFLLPRGMSLYYDALDWLGGFPYEYAGVDEISDYIRNKGFQRLKFNKTKGFTGCNEFVFRKYAK